MFDQIKGEICPKCGKESIYLVGESIRNDRQYGMAYFDILGCHNCNHDFDRFRMKIDFTLPKSEDRPHTAEEYDEM